MKKSREKARNEPASFDSRLKSLESIINRLEADESTLEKSLADFESGIAIAREMQTILETAEQDIRLLLEKNGAPNPESLTPEEPGE
jgi:exodeoxyribonuclease VII small subunit